MKALSKALGIMVLLGLQFLSAQQTNIPDFLKNPEYRGKRINEKKNVHNGNRIAITFFNYGLLAGVGETRGEWPQGSRSNYVGDVVPVVVAEVPITNRSGNRPDTTVWHAITPRHPRNGLNRNPRNFNEFWGFEAMGGFANSALTNSSPAISSDANTWPSFWPDQPSWVDNGKAEWNGFKGRGQFSADLESYTWFDDQSDGEVQDNHPSFQADAADPSRKGLGLSVKARGLQWSTFLVQDVLFFMYEIHNAGTNTYPRVAAGLTVGTLAGGDGDSADDLAFFDQLNRFVYSWDFDGRGNAGQAVGYVGYGFMESPGIDNDGIDNDGDSDINAEGTSSVPLNLRGTNNTFTAADFTPRMLVANAPIVLINATTFARTFDKVPATGTKQVVSQGKTYTIGAGIELKETTKVIQGQIDNVTVVEKNGLDEDLDGLIDEDDSLHGTNRRYETLDANGQSQIGYFPPVRYKNWLALSEIAKTRAVTNADSVSAGFFNKMIDESANDGVDNDGDWDTFVDDVGADGKANTGDAGELDGVPTKGETNFEGIDKDETDQVGLSSFFYFPLNALAMNDDNRLAEALAPGFFTTNRELALQQNAGGLDGDFVFSSGYFRLRPGDAQRFSMALVFGEDLDALRQNVQQAQKIYNADYSFARPPVCPTLSIVPDDKKITLYWDTRAETETIDPLTRINDFEGYKIYKSTDPYFRDPAAITNAFGLPKLVTPIAQYDLSNNVRGVWTGSASTIQATQGVPFYLGKDSGLVHSYVDTAVENGRTYYYAVTSYDAGTTEINPSECRFGVSLNKDGSIKTDPNVKFAKPNAPTNGYVVGGLAGAITHPTGLATGSIMATALDPRRVKNNRMYRVEFKGSPAADSFRVQYMKSATQDSLVVDYKPLSAVEGYVFDGIRLSFMNEPTTINNTTTGYVAPTTAGVVKLNAVVAYSAGINLQGVAVPYDYEVNFTPGTNSGNSTTHRLGFSTVPGKPTQFNVKNITTNVDADYVFIDPNNNGKWDAATDYIIIYETINGVNKATYQIISVQPNFGEVQTFPQTGDKYRLITKKPFSSGDTYVIKTKASSTDDAAVDLSRIKVVPNPYVVQADWERPLPFADQTGRGERKIDFIHLPNQATIRIFTVRGDLVKTLYHTAGLADGIASWDLRAEDGLDVGYGIYFYHVATPDGKEQTGKFALIK
jgi:hypothetical protein